MARIQLDFKDVPDEVAESLKQNASSLRLSLTAYVRMLLIKAVHRPEPRPAEEPPWGHK